MRYEGNKVVITESELRWLVNESVKNTLLTEVGNWAGVKNAWNGLANGKFNLKKSFQTAKQAQTFQKYYNNAQKSITGMQQVLNNSDQPDLANKLQQVNSQLQQAANGFQQRAAQASGRQAQPQNNTNINTNTANTNTAGNTAGNGGAGDTANTNGNSGNVAKTIQMNSNAGQNTENGQQITQAGAAANASTPGLATKMGQGVGKAGAAMRNFAQGVKSGYNQNKVNLDNNQPDGAGAAAKVGTPQAETPQASATPQAEAPKVETPQGGNQEVNPANSSWYVPAEQQGERSQEETQGGHGFENSGFDYSGEGSQQTKQPAKDEGPNKPLGEPDKGTIDAFNGLTRDYDKEYSSVTPRKVMPEGKTIRITQDYIRSLVNETLNILMNEEGEAGGGGATNAAGVMQGGGTNPGAGTYDAPAFGGKNKKKVGGNAFSEPIMRQKHNLGDVTSAPANQVDMKPALKRGGSIAMGESIRRNNIIDEAVDEGIGNWLKGAALGGMMAMSPMQANAQQQQQNNYPQSTIQQSQQMTVKQLRKLFPKAYKDRNARPEVWERNQTKYIAEVNGKICLIGKIAASHGQNPWDALVKKYCPQEDRTFQLGDFDI